MTTVLRIVTHPAFQFLCMTGYLALAIGLRLVLPGYDYLDVAYESSFVVTNDMLDADALMAYLLHHQADQIMALTKLTVFLTNYLTAEYVIVVEIVIAWMMLVVGYLFLLSLLNVPLTGWRSLHTADLVKMLIIFVLYWWPATLPSLTNNWFALQYGLVLACGLGSIYFLTGKDQVLWRYLTGCVLFLLCALSHGTGLLVGPVLSAWLWINRRTPLWVPGFLLGTTLALLASVWLQYDSVQTHDTRFYLGQFMYLVRIVTPGFWEQAIFYLAFLPLLIITLSQFRLRTGRPPATGAAVLLCWGLLVWISTFVARHGLQEYANPHYLRFFVLLYIVLCLFFLDFVRQPGRRSVAWILSLILVAVWIKRSEKGVSMARDFREDNLAGHASLVHDMSVENESTAYIYPLMDHRLTRVLLPRLVGYQPYGYREMLGGHRNSPGGS